MTESKGRGSHQVPDREHVLKVRRHWIMLHGHEECVQHDADRDGQVDEGIHHNQIDDLLDLQPFRAALPDQEGVGKLVPTWRTRTLRLLQLCGDRRVGQREGGISPSDKDHQQKQY